MQKVLQFTRDEVVERLEHRAENLFKLHEENYNAIEGASLLGAVMSLVEDIEYFDVYINKDIFTRLNNLHKELLTEYKVSVEALQIIIS